MTDEEPRRGRRRIYLPGDRFGELVLIQRTKPDGSRNYFGVWACDCGSTKTIAIRNVVQGKTINCADRSKHPDPRWRALRYKPWHDWLANNYGNAREKPCAFCGAMTAHSGWAYVHGGADDRELTDETRKDAGKAYIMDASLYVVLCKRCHGAYDRAWANGSPPVLRAIYARLRGGADAALTQHVV
jgi:hypothetical protein